MAIAFGGVDALNMVDFGFGNPATVSASIFSITPTQVEIILSNGDLSVANGNFFTSNGSVFGVETSSILLNPRGGLIGALFGENVSVSSPLNVTYTPNFNRNLSVLMAGNDIIVGGSANDTLAGYSGNDTIWAGTGSDLILVSTGSDLVIGGNFGQTTIQLYSHTGVDTILLRNGAAAIIGATGTNTSQIGIGQSVDLVGGFNPRIDVIGFTRGLFGINSVQDIFSHISTDPSGNAVIAVGPEVMDLVGVSPAALAAANFFVF